MKAIPPSTTARVRATKTTRTANRNTGTTHSGSPDSHSQAPTTARPAASPISEVR